MHEWYEQVMGATDDGSDDVYVPQRGPMGLEMALEGKEVRCEEDRPRLRFLERQAQLLV